MVLYPGPTPVCAPLSSRPGGWPLPTPSISNFLGEALGEGTGWDAQEKVGGFHGNTQDAPLNEGSSPLDQGRDNATNIFQAGIPQRECR